MKRDTSGRLESPELSSAEFKTGHAQLESMLSELSVQLTALGSHPLRQSIVSALELIRSSSISEARYRSLVETQAHVIARSDISGRLTFVNDAYCRAFGKKANELVGTLFTPTVAPEDLSISLDALQVIQKPPYRHETETRHLTPSGIRWFFWDNSAVLDEKGKVIEFQGVGLDITDRKMTEIALRESEERLRLATRAGHMYAFEWMPATDDVIRSQEARCILELDSATMGKGRDFIVIIHPADREAYVRTTTTLTPHAPSYDATYRIVRPDGSTRWLQERGAAYFDKQQSILRVVGMAADVTTRKEAELEVAELSGRLITTQEEERQRVARELHDNIAQALAVIGMELCRLAKASSDTELASKLDALCSKTKAVLTDISQISHQLHPACISHLGLSSALKGLCREMSEAHGVRVEFSCTGMPEFPPSEIVLPLYRIAQESLQNVAKHSHSTDVYVELTGNDREITLSVRDEGQGFEVHSASRGLGLVSMRERAHLLGGTFKIDSHPNLGSRVEVRVPLKTD